MVMQGHTRNLAWSRIIVNVSTFVREMFEHEWPRKGTLK